MFDQQIISALINVLSISQIECLRRTSKKLHKLFNNQEILGILAIKHNLTTEITYNKIFNHINKISDVFIAFQFDNLYLLEISVPSLFTKIKNKDKLPSNLLPTILSVAVILNSIHIFENMISKLQEEIDIITKICKDHTEPLQHYLEIIGNVVFQSNNNKIYEAFFSTLNKCNWGAEYLFYECIAPIDDASLAVGLPYAHGLGF